MLSGSSYVQVWAKNQPNSKVTWELTCAPKGEAPNSTAWQQLNSPSTDCACPRALPELTHSCICGVTQPLPTRPSGVSVSH